MREFGSKILRFPKWVSVQLIEAQSHFFFSFLQFQNLLHEIELGDLVVNYLVLGNVIFFCKIHEMSTPE